MAGEAAGSGMQADVRIVGRSYRGEKNLREERRGESNPQREGVERDAPNFEVHARRPTCFAGIPAGACSRRRKRLAVLYEHDSTRQVFAHNLIGASKGAGFHLHGKMTDRRIAGRPIESGRHRVLNNILVANGTADVLRGDRNEAAGNLRDGLTASLERGTLEILWSFEGEPPSCASVPGVTRDIRGLPRAAVVPGPFASLPRQGRILLWPLAAGAPALPAP
jgi:hypothetical protein